LASLFSFSSMRQALPPWRVGRRSDRSSDSHPVGKDLSVEASPRVEVRVFNGQIPVRVQDLKAPLFFFLVGFLVWEKLLD